MDFSKPIETFDLIALRDYLVSNNSHKALCGKITYQNGIRSAQTDIIRAYDLCKIVNSFMPLNEYENHTDRLIAESCFSNAVILYASSTHTTSNNRITVQIRDKLTEREKIDHDLLCDLRDNAIAHFGPGGSKSGLLWAQEHTFILAQETGFRIGALSRRLVIPPHIIEALARQIDVAKAILTEIAVERSRSLREELERVAKSDSNFIKTVQQFPIRLEDVTGSTEGAEQALRAMSAGFGKWVGSSSQ